MTQFRLRPLKWKTADGKVIVPKGRTAVIAEWDASGSNMLAKVFPAVIEYRNPISGPTEWTVVEIAALEA